MPSTIRDRLEWSLHEALVVAGIFVAWALAYLAFRLLLVLVRFTFHVARPPDVLGRPIVELLRGGELVLIPVVTKGALATVALYVLIRAGTLIIDHHRGETVFD